MVHLYEMRWIGWFRFVLMELILVITARWTDAADSFDTTRQGGDKSPPTPMGSAIWWLLINASSLPNYNSSINATTPATFTWQNNATTTIQTWSPNNFNSTTTVRNSFETSSIWSSSGDTTGGTTGTTAVTTAVTPTSLWSVTALGPFANSSSTSSVPSSSATLTMPPNFPWVATNLSNVTGGQNGVMNGSVNATLTSVIWSNLTSDLTTNKATASRNGSLVNTSTSVPPVVSARETREPPLDQYPAACRRFDDAELYSRLKERGGYNQYFMANSPDEVGNLPGYKLADDPRALSDKFSDTFRRVQRSTSPDISANQLCTGRCKRISRIVQNALHELEVPRTVMADKSYARDAHDNGWTNKTNDAADILITAPAGNTSISNTTTTTTMRPVQKYGLISGMCRLEHFIPIGQCDQRGSEETDLARLCTACRGVYKLPRGCFPQFLNAITCNSSDIHCIFDRWSKTAHGTCREETLTFTVMHNLGREECQEWRFESVEVPIACQCYLSRSSWLEP